MDVWKRRAVAIDGCVVIELPPEIKSDGKWIGEIDPGAQKYTGTHAHK